LKSSKIIQEKTQDFLRWKTRKAIGIRSVGGSKVEGPTEQRLVFNSFMPQKQTVSITNKAMITGASPDRYTIMNNHKRARLFTADHGRTIERCSMSLSKTK